MNSLILSICEWYRVVPEYSLVIMADTLPKMVAYIRAARETRKNMRHGGRAAAYLPESTPRASA